MFNKLLRKLGLRSPTLQDLKAQLLISQAHLKIELVNNNHLVIWSHNTAMVIVEKGRTQQRPTDFLLRFSSETDTVGAAHFAATLAQNYSLSIAADLFRPFKAV